MKIDGFVGSFPGLDEIIIGVEALVETKVILDCCGQKSDYGKMYFKAES